MVEQVGMSRKGKLVYQDAVGMQAS